jgi:two-component system sensor histidine kinase KdpD
MARGSLRIYLGAAPGVGKTYRMLGEGNRRTARGTDVVVGIVETHGREQTAAQIGGLEVFPRLRVGHRGTVLETMDTEGLIARRPAVVLVDELAHTNPPGSPRAKRWEDVEVLLAAGIDVISTLNVQHLASLNDVIAKITGVTQRETVPDEVVRRADQIELVDMTPEALRRRMAHGNVYPAERIDAALANYFRPGNLSALRELALLWLADRVEESLQSYLEAHDIRSAWETRERIVVGITGAPGGDQVIRRAARIAGRTGGDLLAVGVTADDGLATSDDAAIDAQRRLVAELGGTVHEVAGHDAAEVLVGFARREKATQLVLGATRRSRWHELWQGSFGARVSRLADDIDLHIIANRDEGAFGRTPPRRRPSRPGRRRVVGVALTIAALPLFALALTTLRDRLALSTVMLLILTAVLGVAAIGGRLVGGGAAVVGSLLVNFFFVEPLHTFTIAEAENVVALVVFITVAITVGTLVDVVSERALEARRARAEAASLARSTAMLAAEPDPLPVLVDHIRATFGLAGARLSGDGSGTTSGACRDGPAVTIGIHAARAGQEPRQLELYGSTLSPDDEQLLRIFADQLAVAAANQELAADAREASALAEIDAVRTALLRAVSHDLRTPLASIKAMISGLRDVDVQFTPAQTAEALAAVEEETDRLNQLVGNLLDASRLQIGALAVEIRPADVREVVAGALTSLGPMAAGVRLDPDEAPVVAICDAALLERCVANVVTNAMRHSPVGTDVRIEVARVRDRVHLRVVDRGCGILAADRSKVTAPFQRLGDAPNDDGVGLGLSIAKGFVDAMAGELRFDDTPGGGLTVTIDLPATVAP